eukprot:4661844-Ditylum_brightwellii.AAC.1
MSSTLFDVHQEQGHGAIFTDLKWRTRVYINMVGFVDNTTGQTNNFEKNNVTPEELIKKMTKDVQIWSNLLWISGGLLDLDK